MKCEDPTPFRSDPISLRAQGRLRPEGREDDRRSFGGRAEVRREPNEETLSEEVISSSGRVARSKEAGPSARTPSPLNKCKTLKGKAHVQREQYHNRSRPQHRNPHEPPRGHRRRRSPHATKRCLPTTSETACLRQGGPMWRTSSSGFRTCATQRLRRSRRTLRGFFHWLRPRNSTGLPWSAIWTRRLRVRP